MHSTFCYIFGLWHAGCTKNFCKPRKSLCTQQKRIQFPWSFYDRVIKKTVLDHDVIKAMEFSTKLFKEFKNLITFKDVTTGKCQLQPLQWRVESAPLGWDRVNVSENLSLAVVALVAPEVTSLTFIVCILTNMHLNQ